jgi:hypothetical protein
MPHHQMIILEFLKFLNLIILIFITYIYNVMKTLQQQYNLLKEGQGDKNFFMRQAMRQFPEWVTVNNTFEQTVSILKGKSIISEGAGGVVTAGRKDWFKIFEAEVKAMRKK